MRNNLIQFYQVICFASYVINPLWARRQGKNPFLWFFLSLPLAPTASIFLFFSMKRAERENKKAGELAALEKREAEELAALEKREAEEMEEHRKRQAEEAAFNAAYENSRFMRPPVDLKEWERTSTDYRFLLRLIDCVAEGRGNSELAPNFPVKAKEVVLFRGYGGLTTHDGTPCDDHGGVYITNKRIVLSGNKKTSEWAFSKMIGFNAFDAKRAAVFKLTDQSAVTGIYLSDVTWFTFQFYLNAAFSLAKKPIADFATSVLSDSLIYELQKPLSGK